MMVKPTNRDYSDALRLSRKHIYDGHEPYAPAVSSFARMLAEHRAEVSGGKTEIVMDDRLLYAIDDLKEVCKTLENRKARWPEQAKKMQEALTKAHQALELLEQVGLIVARIR